jgi:hypothetical protein
MDEEDALERVRIQQCSVQSSAMCCALPLTCPDSSLLTPYSLTFREP